jgi:hypothetical protein
MTKRATFTQAQVRRSIQAARREGLRVTGIKPDGTVVVADCGENPPAPVDGLISSSEDADAVRWRDGD